jgi:zinc protease
MRDLNNITVEKCKEFFRQYYAPNNAVVVVAGSFEPRKAKSLIEKYYSKIPSQKIHWTQVPAEPIQQGQRTVVREKDVRNTTFSLAYQAPKAGEADAYAMDLLASILGEGDSSRLYKRLVYRQQMASEVSAFSYTLKDPGVFQVVVSVRPGLEREGVLSAVFSEIWKLQNRSVELAELEKSKNLILKSYIDSLKTVSGKARALALNEVLFGDYSTFFKDLDLYKKVTADDIQRVANLYLKPSQRSVVVVKPKAEAKTVATKEGA